MIQGLASTSIMVPRQQAGLRLACITCSHALMLSIREYSIRCRHRRQDVSKELLLHLAGLKGPEHKVANKLVF